MNIKKMKPPSSLPALYGHFSDHLTTQIEVVEKPMDENNWKHQPSPIHPHLQDLWVVTNSWCLDDDLEIQEWFNRGKGPY